MNRVGCVLRLAIAIASMITQGCARPPRDEVTTGPVAPPRTSQSPTFPRMDAALVLKDGRYHLTWWGCPPDEIPGVDGIVVDADTSETPQTREMCRTSRDEPLQSSEWTYGTALAGGTLSQCRELVPGSRYVFSISTRAFARAWGYHLRQDGTPERTFGPSCR
jgi:hypothetical protein